MIDLLRFTLCYKGIDGNVTNVHCIIIERGTRVINLYFHGEINFIHTYNVHLLSLIYTCMQGGDKEFSEPP